jgi:spore germination protein YaaH
MSDPRFFRKYIDILNEQDYYPPGGDMEMDPSNMSDVNVYKVQQGDTLSSIAAKFNVDLEELSFVNRYAIDNNDSLQVGQKIYIPNVYDPDGVGHGPEISIRPKLRPTTD